MYISDIQKEQCNFCLKPASYYIVGGGTQSKMFVCESCHIQLQKVPDATKHCYVVADSKCDSCGILADVQVKNDSYKSLLLLCYNCERYLADALRKKEAKNVTA